MMSIGGFQWSDISLVKIMQTSEESDFGYFVVVDLNYPSNLHGCHNDFPLAAEKLTIDAEMLSQYQVELGNRTSPIPKLLKLKLGVSRKDDVEIEKPETAPRRSFLWQ